MSVILTSRQYKDLENVIGERNNITRVKGSEYKINNALSTNFINGAKNISLSHSTSSYISNWSAADTSKIFGIDGQKIREEYIFTSGYYDFIVNDVVISNVNSITVSFSMSGASYKTANHLVNGNNYTSYRSVFAGIINNDNKEGDIGLSETDACLTHNCGKRHNWLMGVTTNSIRYPSQYCYVRFIKKETISGVLTYTFRVYYGFITLTGWNEVYENFWGTNYYTNYCNTISSISFTVKGLTIDAEQSEVEFGNGSKLIELQTNELMQTSSQSGSSLFETTAEQIIDAFSSNRAIITFKMTNNIKFVIDGTSRFLRAGDKIKLKDLKGNFISSYYKTISGEQVETGNDFEILKIENIFEGVFYRKLTVREVLRDDQ